jgi:hypothetical protein
MNDLFLSQGPEPRKLHCSEWDPDAFEWMNFRPEMLIFEPGLSRRYNNSHPEHISPIKAFTFAPI